MGDPGGVIEATERLYRSLFAAAVGFAATAVAFGMVIAPFNAFHDHAGRSVALGAIPLLIGSIAWVRRDQLYGVLSRHQAWVLAVAVLGLLVLWADGGWRSSYYLASYSAIILAAVVSELRWSLACACVCAGGYVAGLILHGYSWDELQALKDADSVVANTGGYFVAAVFFALPVAWLSGYVARIHQLIVRPPSEYALPRDRTAKLSGREVQIVQLVSGGLSNEQIGQRLFLSPRTVQSHVARTLRKTGCGNRTELGVLAVREGLVPLRAAPGDDLAKVITRTSDVTPNG